MYQGGGQRSHNKNASLYGQQLGRLDRDRAWAAAGLAGPPDIGAPEASRGEAAVAKMIGRGTYLSCPEAGRAVDIHLEAKRGGLAERGEGKRM